MKTLKKLFKIAAIIIGITPNSFAQENIINMIQQVETQIMTTTVQPLGDALSSNINSGLFNTAKVDNEFGTYIGIKASGTMVNPELLKQVGLENVKVIPFAVPQVGISAHGTEAMFRYMPHISIGGKATVSIWGFGIKHCITSHFKKSPVDVSLQFAYQMLDVKDNNKQDLIVTKSTAVNLQISKEIGFLTLYAGTQYESTNITLSYNFENIITVSKNFDNLNKFRATVGINLGLGPVKVNADYNFGKVNTLSVGLGLGF
jgi:hypothetical protein